MSVHNSKRTKVEASGKSSIDKNAKVLVSFQAAQTDAATESPQNALHIPADSNLKQLNLLLNKLLENEETLPYSFFVNDKQVTASLMDMLEGGTEEKVTITYIPEAVFRVRAVTRCSSTMTGHAEAVLQVVFSPNGRSLASGSGDTTVRIWDMNTETPKHTLKGHVNWVQHVVWSPDCSLLVSGGMDSILRVWDPEQGSEVGVMKGHNQPVTALAFEPMHL